MYYQTRRGKINVKVLVILLVVVVGLGVSLFAARQIRRSILARRDLAAGLAAYESQDWSTASKHLTEYLGRRPEDVEIWKKCAEAKLSVRPFKKENVTWTMGAYRRVLQADPNDEEAFDKLTRLYGGSRFFLGELAHIAEKRHERVPDDRDVLVTYAEAQIGLDELTKAQQALEEFFTGTATPTERTFEEFIDTIDGLASEKSEDYMRACLLVSNLVIRQDENELVAKAVEWLNKALDAAPDPASVLARRARFYRAVAASPDRAVQAAVLKIGGLSDIPQDDAAERLLELARKDLQAVDVLQTDDPKILYVLGDEWLAHNDLDAAEAELEALDKLPQEKLDENFLDPNDWVVSRFDFAAKLLTAQLRTLEGPERQKKALDGASVAETVRGLTETWHQIRVFPVAIPMYLRAAEVLRAQGQLEASHARVADANECLATYRQALLLQKTKAIASPAQVAWLTATVALAQGKPYDVINAAQPIVATNPSNIALWRLLAEAYSQTGQTRRAINAFKQCLEAMPQDAYLSRQLALQYSKLGDWENARKTANTAKAAVESTGATEDISMALLTIGAELSTKLAQDANEAELKTLSGELAELQKRYSENVDIRTFQAVIANHLERPEEAEEILTAAIAECDEPLRARLQLVGLYQSIERTQEAIAAGEAACQHHAKASEPWLSLAALQAANADPNAARTTLERGLKAVPQETNRGLSIGLALLERGQGNQERCRDILQRLAKEDENEIRARVLLLNLPLGKAPNRPNDLTTEELIEGLRRAEGDSGLQWRFHQASVWLRDANEADLESKHQSITDLLQYCISTDPGWPAPVLLLGNMYERLGEFQNAANVYEAGLVHNQSTMVIADKLMAILIRQGRLSEAESVFDKVTVNPRFVSTWQTQMVLQGGDVSAAIDRLEKSLAGRAPDPNALVQLGRLTYQKTSQIDEAFRYLDEAARIAPDSRVLAAVRASIWRSEGQPDKALEVLDRYVANHQDFTAYWMRGVFLAEMAAAEEKEDTAAAYLERAEQNYRMLTTLEGVEGRGYVLLSRLYLQTERFEKAIAVLEEEGLGAYPGDLRLKRVLMDVLLRRNKGDDRQQAVAILGELEANQPQDPGLMMLRVRLILEDPNATPELIQTARDKLTQVVRREPKAVDAHLLLIGIVMHNREFEKARDLAIRALVSNANDSRLLLAQARVELALGANRTAQELAELVLQEDPNSLAAKATFFLARLGRANKLYQAENVIGAKALYQDLLQEDPNNPVVLNDLAWIVQEQDQRYEEALTLVDRGLSLAADDMHLLDTRGTILMHMPGRLADAKKNFDRIIELSSPDKQRQAKTHFQLARICIKLDDPAEAQKHAERALEIDGEVGVFTATERTEMAGMVRSGK